MTDVRHACGRLEQGFEHSDCLVSVVEIGRKRGEIRKGVDLHAVSRRVIALMDGLQTQWLLDPDEVDLVAGFREFSASLKKELAA